MVDMSFGCGTGRALTFPGEIFEHIFTSLVRVSLPDADSGGRVAQYVATYGSRTMSLMVKAIQPARYDVILARIIYCLYKWHKAPFLLLLLHLYPLISARFSPRAFLCRPCPRLTFFPPEKFDEKSAPRMNLFVTRPPRVRVIRYNELWRSRNGIIKGYLLERLICHSSQEFLYWR